MLNNLDMSKKFETLGLEEEENILESSYIYGKVLNQTIEAAESEADKNNLDKNSLETLENLKTLKEILENPKLNEKIKEKNDDLKIRLPGINFKNLRIDPELEDYEIADIRQKETRIIADLEKQKLETRLLMLKRKLSADLLEISKTLIGDKIFREDAVIARSSEYDDYFHGVDELVIDVKHKEVIGAIDDTTNFQSLVTRDRGDFEKSLELLKKQGINPTLFAQEYFEYKITEDGKKIQISKIGNAFISALLGSKLDYGIGFEDEVPKIKKTTVPVFLISLEARDIEELARSLINDDDLVVSRKSNKIKKFLGNQFKIFLNTKLFRLLVKDGDAPEDLRRKIEVFQSKLDF